MTSARCFVCHFSPGLCSASGDHNYIKGNTKFFAVSIQSGGGSLAVIPHEATGKRPSSYPMIHGHKASVLDFDFSPFHEHVIATTSEDCTVKVWGIPEGGLTDNLDDPLVSLAGHLRKTTLAAFHPTAENVLASVGGDHVVKIWDLNAGEARTTVEGHGKLIQDAQWSYTGAVLATACKDKKIRLNDPRTGAAGATTQAHEGGKPFKICWLGRSDKLVSVGFTRDSKRQIRLWDPKKMDECVTTVKIDQASGVIMPFYDEGTNLLFLAGKGDGNVRYFEMVDEAPWAYNINEYRSAGSAKGMAVMPKRAVDVHRCEIARFLKLTRDAVEPLSFILPRKSDMFQPDIFPDCYAGIAAATADEFFAGKDAAPPLVSMAPDANKGGSPKSKAHPALGLCTHPSINDNPPGEGGGRAGGGGAVASQLAAARATIAKNAAKIKDLEAKIAAKSQPRKKSAVPPPAPAAAKQKAAAAAAAAAKKKKQAEEEALEKQRADEAAAREAAEVAARAAEAERRQYAAMEAEAEAAAAAKAAEEAAAAAAAAAAAEQQKKPKSATKTAMPAKSQTKYFAYPGLEGEIAQALNGLENRIMTRLFSLEQRVASLEEKLS